MSPSSSAQVRRAPPIHPSQSSAARTCISQIAYAPLLPDKLSITFRNLLYFQFGLFGLVMREGDQVS